MVELTENEKQLSYAKYFYQPLAEIPLEQVQIARGNAAASEQALPIEARNQFLAGSSSDLKMGFCVAANGTGFVANRTFMANTTVDMLDWWFGWHSVSSDLRYKIWDPEDHYYARADRPAYVLDASVPNHQKTWGVTHEIMEDIGKGPEHVKLSFKNPVDFGYDARLLGTQFCNSLVCAIGRGVTPAFMTHKFYAVTGGTMFESRFWIGYDFHDGNFIKLVPEGQAVPQTVVRDLFSHNIKEYSNLAQILPHVYAEEKWNWE